MAHFLDMGEIRKKIWTQIEKDESPGEQVGGSGHLSQVDCKIDIVYDPIQVPEGWEITYRYTVTITTEFTIYPDNPPWENTYEKTITVNQKGDFLKHKQSETIASNVISFEPFESFNGNRSVNNNEDLVQRAVDLKTGKDITGEYISKRLGELEIIADDIIKNAVRDARIDPEIKREIYETAYWEIHKRLGMGSIGPATAVASGIMGEKKKLLADALEIKPDDEIN